MLCLLDEHGTQHNKDVGGRERCFSQHGVPSEKVLFFVVPAFWVFQAQAFLHSFCLCYFRGGVLFQNSVFSRSEAKVYIFIVPFLQE